MITFIGEDCEEHVVITEVNVTFVGSEVETGEEADVITMGAIDVVHALEFALSQPLVFDKFVSFNGTIIEATLVLMAELFVIMSLEGWLDA